MKQIYESDSEKWNLLHVQLQDMLAGYADDELDKEQSSLVEAHLAGCELCRNDLARQKLITQRLHMMPSPRLSTNAQQDIDLSLTGALSSSAQSKKHKRVAIDSLVNKIKLSLSLSKAISVGGWAMACVLALVMMMPAAIQEKTSPIPMIADALSEYHKHENNVLPVARNDTNKAPVSWPNARLLTTWETTVAGEPAHVYALRSGRNIVFQYHVNETVFFRNPVVRKAIAETGNYKTQTNKLDVIAMPLTDTGILIVGPADSLPAPEKILIESI